MNIFKRIHSYFKKEILVFVQENTIEGFTIPDNYNIYLIHKNKAQMLTNLEWYDMNTLAEMLSNQDRPIQLWRSYGMGREVLTIPEWGIPKLANELKRTYEEGLKKFEDISPTETEFWEGFSSIYPDVDIKPLQSVFKPQKDKSTD